MSTNTNTIISAGNPIDLSTISSGQVLINLANSEGITGGILYLLVNPGNGVWKMVPESQWEGEGLNLNQPNQYLFITFGTPPTSTAWGRYFVLGELLFYMKNQGKTLQQLIA